MATVEQRAKRIAASQKRIASMTTKYAKASETAQKLGAALTHEQEHLRWVESMPATGEPEPVAEVAGVNEPADFYSEPNEIAAFTDEQWAAIEAEPSIEDASFTEPEAQPSGFSEDELAQADEPEAVSTGRKGRKS